MKVNFMNNVIKTVPQDEVGTTTLSYGIDNGLSIPKPEEGNLNQSVKAAHGRILISRDNANSNIIELCFRLFQLNNLARESKEDSFWSEYFDVVNFTEYCERKLDISPNLGSQYLMAARTIERLKPHYLKSIFDNNNEGGAVFPPIGYTRFRAVYKFVPIILKMKGSAEFTKHIELIFDPKESNASVLLKLNESLKPLLINETKGDLPIKARLKKVESLRKRLAKVLNDVKDLLSNSESDLIDNMFEEIKYLLNAPPESLEEEREAPGFNEHGQGEALQGPLPLWARNENDSESEKLADERLAEILPGFN